MCWAQRFNNELANGKLHESDVVGIFARLGVELSSTFLQPFTGLEFVGTVTTGVTHIDIDFLAQKTSSFLRYTIADAL